MKCDICGAIIEGTPENRGSNFNLIDLILLSKLGERRRQNGDRISISVFHLSEIHWLSGEDDFSQNQFGNVHVSCHSNHVFYNKSIGMGTLMALD